jgi:hypothetical protein
VTPSLTSCPKQKRFINCEIKVYVMPKVPMRKIDALLEDECSRATARFNQAYKKPQKKFDY